MPYNLFIEHHEKIQRHKNRKGEGLGSIGTGWEDDFTNILSFYLSLDRKALENFCQLILDQDYEIPISLETQQSTSEGRPDIVINLTSGSSLIIECKVDASLQPNQLQRYLKIEPNPGCQTYVALISKRLLEIQNSDLKNPFYKRPEKTPHFFWTDIYKALPKPKSDSFGNDMMRSFFLDYMGAIGFAPSSLDQNWSKLFEDRKIDKNKKVQEEFGHKLSFLGSWLKEQNYKVTGVSYSGLQAIPYSGTLLELPTPVRHLVIGPKRARKDFMLRSHAAKIDNEALRVAYVFDAPEVPEHAWLLYQSFPTPLCDHYNNLWWPIKPNIFSKNRVRLEFVSNMDRFLEKESEIEDRIKLGCVTVIEKIYEIINNIVR
jgi:hypothetical protein